MATKEPHWEETFRTSMAELRKRRGITQTALARELSEKGLPFHQPTIQRIENGERPIRLDEAYLIADALSSTVNEMLNIRDWAISESVRASELIGAPYMELLDARARIEDAQKHGREVLGQVRLELAKREATGQLAEGVRRAYEDSIAGLEDWLNMKILIGNHYGEQEHQEAP